MPAAIPRKITSIRVDRASHEGPASQISRKLAEYILDGRCPANSKLPTHGQFAAQLGVSGVTVQKAMNELVERGLIKRTRRLGMSIFAHAGFNATTVVALLLAR